MHEDNIKKIEKIAADGTEARLAIQVRMDNLLRDVNNAVDSIQPLLDEVYRGTSYYHQFIRDSVDAKQAVTMLYSAMTDLSKAMDITYIKNAVVIKSMHNAVENVTDNIFDGFSKGSKGYEDDEEP